MDDFAVYWRGLLLKNPMLEDEETVMSMTAGSFCVQIRKAYEARARSRAKLADDLKDVAGKKSAFDTMFGDIFGHIIPPRKKG